MSILSFNISLNHIYFFLLFLNYFLREISLEVIDNIMDNKDNEDNKDKKDFTFGNSSKAARKFFNMYIYTLSNLFSFFCIIIIKKRTNRYSLYINDTNETINKSISSKELEYIYTGDIPINKKKLFKRTYIITVCDFSAQYIVFLLYIIVNDDEKLEINKRLDIFCIFNILFQYLFSKMILKTKYYKHHYLSFAINIFCLIILGSYELTQIELKLTIIIYIVIRIFSKIIYSLEDVVGKRALIEEFLSPYSLLAYIGIYELIILLIFSFPFFFIKRGERIIFSCMEKFLDNFVKILLFFILMILNFTYNILIWIIIDRFSPNDYAMAMVIEGITDKILSLILKKAVKIWLFSIQTIIYFILVFGICIHSEIIIINKFGLNENTKKRFAQTGDEEYQLAKSFARPTATTFDNDEKGKIERMRAASKQVKNVGTLKLDKIKRTRSKTISPLILEDIENINVDSIDK